MRFLVPLRMAEVLCIVPRGAGISPALRVLPSGTPLKRLTRVPGAVGGERKRLLQPARCPRSVETEQTGSGRMDSRVRGAHKPHAADGTRADRRGRE